MKAILNKKAKSEKFTLNKIFKILKIKNNHFKELVHIFLYKKII